MLAFPFPYIANTLGWMTTELGRLQIENNWVRKADAILVVTS